MLGIAGLGLGQVAAQCVAARLDESVALVCYITVGTAAYPQHFLQLAQADCDQL